MMRRLVYSFTLGVAVGFLVHSAIERPQAPIVIEKVAEAPAPKRAQIVAPARETLTITPGWNVTPTPGRRPAIIEEKKPEETSHSIAFRLEEESIARMEKNRDDLRQYGYTEPNADGWKIRILPEDKVFLQSGIRDGDVITYESLQSQLANPERQKLADRFVAILRSIER